MGIIVKAYTLADVVVSATTANRLFDDIYNEFNGNIDSDNIDISTTFGFSQIEGSMDEVVRGLHTIHVMPQGTNGIVLFPGKIEVNDTFCTLSEKFQTTAITAHESAGQNWYSSVIICVGAATEITASDLAFLPMGYMSASSSFLISKGGYYPEFFSGDRRVMATLGGQRNIFNKAWSDFPQIDGPTTPFVKNLTETEASGLYFRNLDFTDTPAIGTITSIVRVYDTAQATYSHLLCTITESSTSTGASLNIYGPAPWGCELFGNIRNSSTLELMVSDAYIDYTNFYTLRIGPYIDSDIYLKIGTQLIGDTRTSNGPRMISGVTI